ADTFSEKFDNILPDNPLDFVDTESYSNRLEKAREKSGNKEAIITGTCQIHGHDAALGVLDFNFLGGSMGSVVGEKLTLLIEHAAENSLPLVVVSASGGARMQESILSLMQMAKTSAALGKLDEEGVPYISILTNPTTGGVTASFATLGDIIIAEPGALIAFAGPRVVEQTIREKLPPGAQRAEFVMENGLIDCIVPRKELKKKIAIFIDFLSGGRRKAASALPKRLQELMALPEQEDKKLTGTTQKQIEGVHG
ncbi:MAG: acetyl-CoA carboxylase carboxyl transferase subunit beta, partial [Proteobacteria bacterium]|nr:acetyl-CoA carboxylase carboxyl transferase subunit beta [Pseudomonadota bacterium]